MALKHKIAQLTDVAEAIRSLYEVGPDGAFYLQVEGMVPKQQVDEFRTNNIQLMQENEQLKLKYKDLDPVKYAEYKAAAEKTPEAIEAAVKARVSQLKGEHETTVNDLTTKWKAAETALDSVLVDGGLKTVAAKAGALPTALDDVVFRGRTVFRRENGQITAYNEKGEKLYDKDGTSPLSMEGWVKGLKQSAPHLFQGMNGSGGQGGAHGTGGLPANATSVQKIQAGLNSLSPAAGA